MEVNNTDYPPQTKEEVLRWMPEARDIRNDTLQEMVVGVLIDGVPGYFWHAPAASKHHPKEHRQRHGLVLHTKRVCTAFERIATSMVKQGHLEWEDVDYGRAACILHDMFKFGVPPTSVDETVSNHDRLASEWLTEHTQLPKPVIEAVDQHNGPWYRGDMPDSHLSQMVHVADMHASDENVRIAVKDPHPILEDQFPRVGER